VTKVPEGDRYAVGALMAHEKPTWT
jgi:hypothetical protein